MKESKEETVAVVVVVVVMQPDKHSPHPTSHIWKSPHRGRRPPRTQACGAAAPQPDRYNHKQRAGPRRGLTRREGHTHRSGRTSRRQRRKEDKEKAAWVGVVVFLVLFSSSGSDCGRPRLAARVCQEELESRQRCAALP